MPSHTARQPTLWLAREGAGGGEGATTLPTARSPRQRPADASSVLEAAGGRVKLAMPNVGKEAQLAGGLGVQRCVPRRHGCRLFRAGHACSPAPPSIPAVFGIHQGRLVDRFQGAVPPEQIKSFVDALVAAGSASGADAGAGEEEEESPSGLIARATEVRWRPSPCCSP